jgi:hypothetical protein
VTVYTYNGSRDISVGIATRLRAGQTGFEFRQKQTFFLYSGESTRAGGPTQPPIQGVPGALSLGVEWQERKADHSPPSSVEVKYGEAISALSNMSSWRDA